MDQYELDRRRRPNYFCLENLKTNNKSIMAILNKLTAKYPISGGKVPKGATLQVVSQSIIPTQKEIAAAIKCQLGVEVPAGNCNSGGFTIERIR